MTGQINGLLGESVTGHAIPEAGPPALDLLKINFEALIESYNAGSRSIEELVTLSNSLSDEQERHVRENMSEKELVTFDILTCPAPELSAEERAEVKKAAHELLAWLKALLVLNWRQKSTARSQLKLTIEDALDSGLLRALNRSYSTRSTRRCSSIYMRATWNSVQGCMPNSFQMTAWCSEQEQGTAL